METVTITLDLEDLELVRQALLAQRTLRTTLGVWPQHGRNARIRTQVEQAASDLQRRPNLEQEIRNLKREVRSLKNELNANQEATDDRWDGALLPN